MIFLKLFLNGLYQALFQIEMSSHRARLRDVMGQFYSIYACTCTTGNRVHYSSVHITFCGLWKWYLGKNLTGRKCQACGAILYKICGKITPFKTMWMQSVPIVVGFPVIIWIPEYRFCAWYHIYLFFHLINFLFFLN